MSETNKVGHDIHPLLMKRWSPKAFSSKMLSKEQIESLFEAARWAPSSFNEQPWAFIIASKQDDSYDALFDCLNENNKKWAVTAPLIGISLAKKFFDLNGRPNRHYMHDVGLAMAELATQATYMGICIHQMAGFFPGKVLEYFNVPDDYEPVAMFAIGYPGNKDDLPEGVIPKDKDMRTRKEIEEFVFTGNFGKTSEWVK